MPALHVIADAPNEVTLTGDKATSRVQIAKTGVFKDPRYGTFKITLADFSKWVANFQQLHREGGREGLPVDIDHGPEKSGNTEAAGWVTSLSIKNNELWATVEWNSLGKELVADRRYKYLSPSYVHNYKDEHGKEHGTALIGVALTNRPFLTMATVNLSTASFAEQLPDEEQPYTPEQMPDLKNIAQALKLSEDSDETAVLSKIGELVTASTATPVSLEDQATAAGKFLLTADQFASLSQQASEGAAAAKTLATMKFDNKFDKCLAEGKVTPAQRDLYTKMYETQPEETIALLDTLQPVVNVEPQGVGSGPADNPTLSRELREEAGEHMLDEKNVKLHERTLAIASERSLDYGDALFIAAEELGYE